jgi:hypothetical protein
MTWSTSTLTAAGGLPGYCAMRGRSSRLAKPWGRSLNPLRLFLVEILRAARWLAAPQTSASGHSNAAARNFSWPAATGSPWLSGPPAGQGFPAFGGRAYERGSAACVIAQLNPLDGQRLAGLMTSQPNQWDAPVVIPGDDSLQRAG